MFIFSFFKKQPLLIFLLIAAIIFAADYGIERNKKIAINITPEMRNVILNQEIEFKGKPLTSAEAASAINTYIDTKIILAEAKRLGLDKEYGLRSTLLKKYRVYTTATLPEPTATELEKYYAEHLSDYMSAIAWDIEQIHFRAGEAAPDNFAAQLSNTENTDSVLNKLHLVLTPFPKMGEHEMQSRMGKDVADVVIKTTVNTWVGPLTNDKGTYFVRILARYDSVVRPFSDVGPFVRDAWINSHQNAMLQEKIASLKNNYSINIAGN